MSTVLTLTILSDVSSEAEVFNNLIQVRREDTGEEGLLLCSHCCRWPKELIPRAKWLEGCYTPRAHKDNPKLLTGFHPRSMTHWRVEGKTLTLAVPDAKGESGEYDGDDYEEALSLDFYPPAPRTAFSESSPYGYTYLDAEQVAAMFPQRRRYIQGLWEQAGQGRGYSEQVLAFFRMVDASRLPLWVKRMAIYHLESEEYYSILNDVSWTREIAEHRYCEEFIDSLRVVVSSNRTAGFAVAQRVGLQADITLLQEAVVQYCVDTYGEFPMLEFNIEQRIYQWKAYTDEFRVQMLIGSRGLEAGDQGQIGRFINNTTGSTYQVHLDNGKVVLV